MKKKKSSKAVILPGRKAAKRKKKKSPAKKKAVVRRPKLKRTATLVDRFEELFECACDRGDLKLAHKALEDIERLSKGQDPTKPESGSSENIELAKQHLEAMDIPRRSIHEMARLAVQKFVQSGQGKG